MAGRPKVRDGAVPCATPGAWSGGQGPLQCRCGRWVPVDVPCAYPCVGPSVLAVCPAAPRWVPGPHKHPHLAPASLGHLGHPELVTLLVPVPVPHQSQTPKSPAHPLAQAPGHPFHRYRQCWCQSPSPGPGLGAHPHPSGATFLLPGAGTTPFPVLPVSVVTPCAAPLLPVPRCLFPSPVPLLLPICRSGTGSSLPVLPAGASAGDPRCRYPRSLGVPEAGAAPSAGAGKSRVPALCAAKSRCPRSRYQEVSVPASTVGCCRCQQVPVRVNPSASLLVQASPGAAKSRHPRSRAS